MKYLHLFLLFFCLVEIYGQRGRLATSTESSQNTDRPARGRGRSRFVVTDEFNQLTNSDTSVENRRTSSSRKRPVEGRTTETRVPEARQRINPRPATATPVIQARSSYAVEELINESPIDSFTRRSRPRVLTETQFNAAPVSRSRASLDLPIQTQARALQVEPQIDEELANGFGNAAREILSARGYKPPEQTTQKPDEEVFSSIGEIARSLAPTRPPPKEEPEDDYIFGNAARSLIASRGGVLPSESTAGRATLLRSETPILNRDDLRRSEIGAEPLPSLRGSDIEQTRRTSARGESRRTSSRQESEKRDRGERTQNRGRSRTREDNLSVRGPDPELTRQTLARGGPEIIERTPSKTQNLQTDTEDLPDTQKGAFSVENFEVRDDGTEAEAPQILNSDIAQMLENSDEVSNIESNINEAKEIPLLRETPEQPSIREKLPKPLFTEEVDKTRNFIPTTYVRTTELPPTTRRSSARTRSRVEKVTEEVPEVQPAFRANSVENYVKFDARPTEENSVEEPREEVQSRRVQSEIYTNRRSQQIEQVAPRRPQIEENAPRRAPQVVDTPKIQVPTKKQQQPTRRIQLSSRSRIRTEPEEPVTSYSRSRNPRTRATRKPTVEEPATRPRFSARRQYDEVPAESRTRAETKTRGPSVFLANDGEITPRSRSGRRIESEPQRFTIELSATTSRSRSSSRTSADSGFPEERNRNEARYNEPATRNGPRQRGRTKIVLEEVPTKSNANTKGNFERSSRVESANNRATLEKEPVTKSVNSKINLKENSQKKDLNGSRKLTNSKSKQDERPSRTARLETKSRYLEIPFGIDESKLEVLPLFEIEPKMIASPNKFDKSELRTKDFLELTATDNIVKFVEKTVTNAATRRSVTRTEIIEAKTIPTTQKRTARTSASTTTTKAPITRPPIIKESVVAEYNEVTSKSTITRKKKGGKPNRGSKKADVKMDGLKKKNSDEEIGEEDNYPEPFKALLAKKKMEKSSVSKQSTTLKSNNIVTSSTTKPTSVTSARRISSRPQIESIKDNEIEPKTKPTESTSQKSTTRRKYQPSKTTDAKPKPTIPTQSRKTTVKNGSESKHKRKQLRSTAFPPSTTPLPIILPGGRPTPHRFSAKFVKKEAKTLENKVDKSTEKGVVSSKSRNEKSRVFNKTEKFIEKSTPVPIRKFNRYSSKYRSDLSTKIGQSKSTTGAPFYVPTIPTPVYVPTVPTVKPSPQSTVFPTKRNARNYEDYESITIIDEQQNDIPSDNLVRDGTTEKAVSIIERIINSITAISTTASPSNDTAAGNEGFSTTADSSDNSAILKLAPKKSDKDRHTYDSVTSEKPTTKIIEKILVSLNAIQSNEVGSAPVSSSLISSSTPLSTFVTKSSKYSAKYSKGSNLLPAQMPAAVVSTSTSVKSPINENSATSSVSPLSVFDEIDENQVLEKRTIGKLLDILNGLANPSKRPREYVIVTPKHSSPKSISTVPFSQPDSTVSSLQELLETSTITPFNTQSTEALDTQSTEDYNSETITVSSSNTTPQSTETVPTSTTLESSTSNEMFDLSSTSTQMNYVVPKHHSKFEVSPDKVSVYSANDLSNSVTSSDANTVTIASRIANNFDNIISTTDSITSTTELSTSTTEYSTESSTITTEHPTITTFESTTTSEESNLTTTTNVVNNSSVINRSGRILSSQLSDVVSNNLDVTTSSSTTSTTPDYYVFAVLNNNTILRKKPPTLPNKEVPFLIVGLYPNNTVIKRFPNGTIVPMEQIIKVSGFDTRPDPPPLIEITSNQVTNDPLNENGLTTDADANVNLTTVDSDRMPKELESFIDARNAQNSGVSNNTLPPMTSSTTIRSASESNNVSTRSNSTTVLSTIVTDGTVLNTDTSTESITLSSTSLSIDNSSTTTAENITKPSKIPMEISSIRTVIESSSITATAENSTSTVLNTETSSTVLENISTTESAVPSTLNELLNGKTVKALNNIIKTDDISSTKAPPQVNKYNEVLNIQDLINKNNQNRWKPILKPEEIEIRTVGPPGATTANIRNAPYAPETSTTEQTNTLVETTSTSTTKRPSTSTSNSVRVISQPPSTGAALSNTRSRSTTPMPEVTPKATTPISALIPSTILPTLISTLFPSLVGGSTARSGRSGKSSTDRWTTESEFDVFSVSASTVQPTSVAPPISTSQKISTTTTPVTSTTSTTTSATTTTTTESTTSTTKGTITTTKKSQTTTKKLKQLTEEQKRNLEEIAKLEKQQAELLRQLNFLTSVFGGPNVKLPNGTASAAKVPGGGGGNLGPLSGLGGLVGLGGPGALGGQPGGPPSDLASRILSMAVDRNKSTTKAPKKESASTTTKKPTTKRPNSIQDQLPTTSLDVSTRTTPSLEDVLKQYNLTGLSTPEPLTSTYGKSDEAILATILKQQGIEPTTPKDLADQLKDGASTTKKPKPRPRPRTTTPRPSGLMRGLNWLLDLLDPPTTRRPATRKATTKRRTTKAPTTTAKAETNTQVAEGELLTHQPTRITPIVTLAPIEKITKPSLSQDEIQSLIKQLEAAQENPKAANEIDFSKIKSLQTLLDVDEGVQVISQGNNGATLRATDRTPKAIKTTRVSPVYKATTPVPSSVSNRIEDDDDFGHSTNTAASTTVLPPVSLNPIPGVDDRGQGDNFIRSNLLNAAVGVTRAISNFFSSAIQGARQGFRTIIAGAASGTSSLSG